MYNWQNLALLVAGLVNLFMSAFVFGRGIKNKVNLSFGLLTFFNFTWSFGLLLSRSMTDMYFVELCARSTYISAIAIIVALFYFVRNFPFCSGRINVIFAFILWSLTIGLSFFVYTHGFIYDIARAYSDYEYRSFYTVYGFFIYATYFVFVAVYSVVILVKKYKITEGLVRRQLRLLLVTIIIGLIFGSYFDLFVQYSGDFRLNWLGPIFTVLMNVVVFYFIISPREKISD